MHYAAPSVAAVRRLPVLYGRLMPGLLLSVTLRSHRTHPVDGTASLASDANPPAPPSTPAQLHSTPFSHPFLSPAIHHQRLHIVFRPLPAAPFFICLKWHYVQYGRALPAGAFILPRNSGSLPSPAFGAAWRWWRTLHTSTCRTSALLCSAATERTAIS